MKIGQKVWYINHWRNELEEGILASTENQSTRNEHPTLLVKGKYGIDRVLSAWTFRTEKRGKAGFRKKINQDIRDKQNEIKLLKSIYKDDKRL